MTIKPIIQVREIIENVLNCTTKLNKSFHKFFIEAMQLYLTIQGHVNFTQMARFGHSCESRFCDSKLFMGQNYCQARSKEAMSFAFNMSLTSINVAHEFARQNNLDLSISSIKTLRHNAAMLERFISMFGKLSNFRLNKLNSKSFYCMESEKPLNFLFLTNYLFSFVYTPMLTMVHFIRSRKDT